VWLRGEAKTPALIKRVEARAAAIPEVERVENLLHLPKTPAPSRTDTPPSQRRTRRTKTAPGARKVSPGKQTDEAPAPAGAETSPRAAAAARKGRSPAPLGSQGEEEQRREEEGPDVAHLDDDPAYNPKSPGLRDLKGG
jgi:hypothetical protein